MTRLVLVLWCLLLSGAPDAWSLTDVYGRTVSVNGSAFSVSGITVVAENAAAAVGTLNAMSPIGHAISAPTPVADGMVFADSGTIHDGISDDTGALQQMLNSLSPSCGVLVLGPNPYLVNSANLTVPACVTVAGRPSRGTLQPGQNPATNPYSFILNPSYTISLGTQATLYNINVIRAGMFVAGTLATNRSALAAMSGTAVTVAGSDVLISGGIYGFSRCVYSSGHARVRIEHLSEDCTSGITIDNSHDVSHITDVENINFVTPLAAFAQYAISGAASNGGGGTRLTTAPNALATGDMIVTTGITGSGLPSNINGRWSVTEIDATHVDIPVAFSGSYASGGAVTLNLAARSGAALTMTNSETLVVNDWYEYGHDVGVHIGAGAVWFLGTSISTDNYCPARDLVPVGILIDGNASATSIQSGYESCQGNALVSNSTAVVAHTIANVKFNSLMGTENTIESLQGKLTVTGGSLAGGGVVYTASSAVQTIYSDDDFSPATLTFQNAAAQSATILSAITYQSIVVQQ